MIFIRSRKSRLYNELISNNPLYAYRTDWPAKNMCGIRYKHRGMLIDCCKYGKKDYYTRVYMGLLLGVMEFTGDRAKKLYEHADEFMKNNKQR